MTRLLRENPWSLVPADDNAVGEISAQTGVSAITARVLVGRGVTTPEAVERFFSPRLERDWLDPACIPGMAAATDVVAEAIRAGEHVVVFGDFDLDGISSAAVATRGLEAMGARVTAVVPHRFTEGYGLSTAAIERIMPLRPNLLVTVDCGISAADEIALLADKGVRTVVTDHHEPGDRVPTDIPVADPKLEGSVCGSADLSGAGVALKLVQAVGERLGFPHVWRDLTDLATLGTIADIVPLTAENRALVADGIARMRVQPRVAVAALAAAAGTDLSSLTADGVAFALAPRMNAAGRMADPQVALDLLLTDDPTLAESLARALDELNRTRRSTEADLSEAASAMADRIYAGERALVLSGEGWHEGVKGIVASRLAARFKVPVLLFAIEDGIALGSGRSVGSVDLFQALESCSDVLTRFGGHAAAAGCALPADDLDRFTQRLLAHLDTLPAEQFRVERSIDALVELSEISVELGAELAQLEPFGHGNRRPLLAVGGVFMNGRQRVGKLGNHLRFVAFDGAVSVQAIAFRCPEIDQMAGHEAAVDLAFSIAVDEWRGRNRVQMRIEDVIAHEPSDDAPAHDLIEDLFARADEILAREEYAGISEAPSFHTKLAGVTFEGRQEVLGRISAGTPLRLERQPQNPFDTNACALFDPQGDQIGFLNRRLAAALAPSVDAGVGYDVEVTEVTGGDDGRSLGVNVLVSRRDSAETEDERATERARRRAELATMEGPALDAELTRCFIGDRQLHAAQTQALSHLAAGESTLTVMATGRGKSLIFHLHAARMALRHSRASVFVYPLRALVSDQAHHLEEVFAEVGLTVRTVTGESNQGERDQAFADLRDGRLDVALTTPEFLHLYANRFAASGRIGFLVIDEAHHVGLSRAGNRPAYARLGETLEPLGNPTVLAVTATADDAAARAIQSSLGISATVLDPTVRENLVVEDRRDVANREAYVEELVSRGEKTVVYVNSREQTVRLARRLRKHIPQLAMRTAFYNGGMGRQMRHAVERAFRTGEINVIIATSAFGEGVNVPDIRNVVLFHLPFSSVEFNQMSGRAGRDGALARVHLLFGGKDARINESILSSLAPERDDMAALYVVLRDVAAAEGSAFEITNAELAERCKRVRRNCQLDERGISSALGILRDLGFVTGEGHGAYRRLSFTPSEQKVNLEGSLRYAEGKDEIAEFRGFKAWVLSAEADELLARFNRPILPAV
jgi:single-stranded-DNA-specific exonuclease